MDIGVIAKHLCFGGKDFTEVPQSTHIFPPSPPLPLTSLLTVAQGQSHSLVYTRDFVLVIKLVKSSAKRRVRDKSADI